MKLCCWHICERSLTPSTGCPTGPPCTTFVRVEMLLSGFLIRQCECGGSIIHIVDHNDLDVSNIYPSHFSNFNIVEPIVLSCLTY